MIVDDGDASNTILYLLMRHLGYAPSIRKHADICLQILTATSSPHVVCLGSTITALATLVAASQEPSLQRHVYILMAGPDDQVPAFARKKATHATLLVLPRPWSIARAMYTIAYAEGFL
jgi:hypothetical protein